MTDRMLGLTLVYSKRWPYRSQITDALVRIIARMARGRP